MLSTENRLSRNQKANAKANSVFVMNCKYPEDLISYIWLNRRYALYTMSIALAMVLSFFIVVTQGFYLKSWFQ